jgi:hypothetical protein
MLSVTYKHFVLSRYAVMLTVIMQTVIILSVMAPFKYIGCDALASWQTC